MPDTATMSSAAPSGPPAPEPAPPELAPAPEPAPAARASAAYRLLSFSNCLAWRAAMGNSSGIMRVMKTVLFDNDGTLVDTHELILASMRYSTRTVLGRVIPDEVLMHKVGQPLAVQMRDFTADPDEQSEILRVYREHNHAIHDDVVKAFPGALEALKELEASGVRMGVVTSKMHALAWRGLEITGLAPYLGCCIGADDCDRFKPEPDPVLKGAEELGAVASECFYVGDSPFDIQAGNAAGCKTMAVTWGMFPLGVLSAESPDFTCHSFSELIEVVLR